MPEGKPTIPDVIERFADYLETPGNGAWGSLHCVLDDGNVRNSDIVAAAETARAAGDVEGEALATVLMRMSRTQRERLPGMVDRHVAARVATVPAR